MYASSCGPIANYGIHTLTPKKPEKANLGIDSSRVQNMFKVFEKNTIFHEDPLSGSVPAEECSSEDLDEGLDEILASNPACNLCGHTFYSSQVHIQCTQ